MSTRYVWGQYTRQLQTGYRTRYREVTEDGVYHSWHIEIGDSFYIGSNYSFSTTSGSYSYSGGSFSTFIRYYYFMVGSFFFICNKKIYYFFFMWSRFSSYIITYK